MYRVDVATAVVEKPAYPAGGTPGYFANCNPGEGFPGTQLSAYWFNRIQEEISGVIEFSGAVLDPADDTQLRVAIQAMIAAYLALDPDEPIGYRPFITKAIDFAATAIHVNSIVEFTAPAKVLSLPAIAGLNGYILTVRNAAAAGDITVDGNLGETINGKQTILLRPGDSIDVVATDTEWRIVGGRRTYRSTPATYGLSQKYTWTHGLGTTPTGYRIRVKCNTAEQGWAVGDIIDITPSAIYYTYGWTQHLTDTAMIFMTQHSYTPGINHKTTVVEFELTAAYWDVFCELEVVY